jgi:hypothetical protein
MPLATFPSFGCLTHIRTSASRYDSGQEPDAVVLHVRICAGGGEQSPSLPRPLDSSPAGLYWTGLLTALCVSGLSLGLGAQYLLSQMRLNPAQLLRSGG